MAGKFITELAENMGWKAEGDTAYGIYMGIPFNVRRDINGAAFTTAWLSEPAQINDAEFLQFLKSKKKEHKIHGMPQKTQAGITVQQNKAMGVMNAEEVKGFVREYAGFLTGKGVTTGCANCGNTDQNAFYNVEGNHVYLCNDCGTAVASAKEQQLQAEAKGNNGLGLAGAILGGIAGMIAIILLAMLGRVAAFGGVLMAFCIFYGFKFFKGKLRSRAFVITSVIIIAIIMTFLSEIAYLTILLMQSVPDLALGQAIAAAFMIPFDPVMSPELNIWGDIGQLYLFTAIGVGVWLFNYIRRRKKETAKVVKSGL